jgi:hypothetical protein
MMFENLETTKLNKKALFLLTLLLCSALAVTASCVRAQITQTTPSPTPTATPTPTADPTTPPVTDTGAPSTNMYSINMPNYDLYSPVRIVVTYTYTQSYSINVTSFGQTLHEELSSPTSIEFDTSADDVYQIAIVVSYAVWVNQTVTISVYQNSTGAEGQTIQLAMDSEGFTINMLVSTSPPPSYPTEQELVSGLLDGVKNELLGQEVNQQNFLNSVSAGTIFVGALAAIAFGVTIAVLVLYAHNARKLAKIEAFLNKNEVFIKKAEPKPAEKPAEKKGAS